jgi:hypothetical protein
MLFLMIESLIFFSFSSCAFQSFRVTHKFTVRKNNVLRGIIDRNEGGIGRLSGGMINSDVFFVILTQSNNVVWPRIVEAIVPDRVSGPILFSQLGCELRDELRFYS